MFGTGISVFALTEVHELLASSRWLNRMQDTQMQATQHEEGRDNEAPDLTGVEELGLDGGVPLVRGGGDCLHVLRQQLTQAHAHWQALTWRAPARR